MPHPELRVDGWPFLKQASVMAEMSEQLLIAEVERRLTDKHPHIRSDRVLSSFRRCAHNSRAAQYAILFHSWSNGVPVRSWQSSRKRSPSRSEIETKDKWQTIEIYCSAMQLATFSW